MKLTRICVVSLGCVAGAFSFGVVANAALDLVMPAKATAVSDATASVPVKAADEPVQGVQAQPASFALASVESRPVTLGPVGPAKVKTFVVHDRGLAEAAANEPVATVTSAERIPLPRPRPSAAPHDGIASVASQPGSLAIAAATRKIRSEDGEMLSAAGIDRMKTALALTAEQEEYWPAIASELQTLGKVLKGKGEKHVDNDTMQRLYWAAAPLISRLSYDQKMKVKQMARVMGLNQVAEAL
jgi:hypothetical protein